MIETMQRATECHQQGRFVQADSLYRKLLNRDPYNSRALHMRGVLKFQQGDLRLAEELMSSALQHLPDDPWLHYHLGEVRRSQGEFETAEAHYRSALALGLTDADVYFMLGNVLFEQSSMADAADSYRQALQLAPEDSDIHLNLANALQAMQQSAEAIEHMQLAVRHAALPEAVSLRKQLAGMLIDSGRYDEARLIIDAFSYTQRQSATVLFQSGLCAQAAGQFVKAATLHRAALFADPQLGSAAYSLAANGSTVVTREELRCWMHRSENSELSVSQRANYLFAIARVLDTQKKFDKAFENYVRGNNLVKQQHPFDPDAWDSYIGQLITTYDQAYFEHTALWGSDGEGLVFIVGMPRSGSTLLEAQITQNFNATALGEHAAARRLFHDLPQLVGWPTPTPDCATQLTPEHIKQLRTQYAESLPENCDRIVVDKMLGNFIRLGLIATLFPKARVIHATRDKRAACVSCYTNVFARGLRFTYDLYWLGRAWKSYERLMQHWRDVLPLRMLEVNYESIVCASSDTTAQIGNFISADYRDDDADGSGNINTASFWQARQPVYDTSLAAWKRFEPFLEPLERGLGFDSH